MTFEEAFHSGCRFRLPEDATGIGTWSPNFYWKKIGEDLVGWGYGHNIGNHSQKKNIVQLSTIMNYKSRTDWEINQEDLFHKNMEKIINDTDTI